MNKCIVQTTGPFMLLTRSGPINVGIATVVEKDSFVSDRLRRGDLEVLADNLPANLTQDDLLDAGSVENLLESLRPKAEPVSKTKTSAKKAG